MNDITYVGLDVHKARVCVAIAENGRGGEVRQVGIFELSASQLSFSTTYMGFTVC